MLPQQEVIRHARDIVANHTVPRLPCSQFEVIFRHRLGVSQVIAKELLERVHRAVPLFDYCRMIIEPPV
jgi:hypothetical protein